MAQNQQQTPDWMQVSSPMSSVNADGRRIRHDKRNGRRLKGTDVPHMTIHALGKSSFHKRKTLYMDIMEALAVWSIQGRGKKTPY